MTLSSNITPSDEQYRAIKAIVEWYGDKNNKELYLAGYAGVGKSTIVEFAIMEIRAKYKAKNIYTAAYTGKAASVLRKKGNPDACTIHGLIYVPKKKKGGNPGEIEFILSEGSLAESADLIILDECFSRDTMIDTPTGFCYIQDVKPGDKILNAHGVDTVVAIMKKEAKDAIQIKYNGKTVTSSKNHRYFTDRGFVNAEDIRPGDTLVGQPEALRLLQQKLPAKDLERSFLQSELLGAVVASVPGIQSEDIYARKGQKMWGWAKEISRIRLKRGSAANRKDPRIKSCKQSGNAKKNQSCFKGNGSWPENQGWEWLRHVEVTGKTIANSRGWLAGGICNIFGGEKGRLSYALQSGYSEQKEKSGNRIRWFLPLLNPSPGSRQKENKNAGGFRVESTEVLELGDSRLDKLREADGKLYLYDIQAERHSSFSVSGALVHNCSMIDDKMANDLRSFKKKILVVGDPGQLPPINGQGAFTKRDPDIFLNQIHRQAADSPIIELATLVRKGKALPKYYNKGGTLVTPLTADSQERVYQEGTQVLCGKNSVRWVYTQRIRKRLGYHENEYFEKDEPQPGERVICCKNNHTLGFFNGNMGILKAFENTWDDYIGYEEPMETYCLSVQMEDIEKEIEQLHVDPVHFKNHFAAGEVEKLRVPKMSFNEFDWAYVITCHKAQGSSWDHVTIVDDSAAFRENAAKWLYTSLTRAETGLTLLTR